MPRALLLVLAPFLLCAQDPDDPQDKGTSVSDKTGNESEPVEPTFIRPSFGDIHIWKDKEQEIVPVEERTDVFEKDRFGTTRGEYAVFSGEGGTLVALRGVQVGKEKGLGLVRKGQKLLFKLFQGRIVLKAFETDIVVETAHGNIEAKQAYFLVEVNRSSTKIVSVQGKLRFTNSLGSVTINSEESLTARRGSRPGEPRKKKDMDNLKEELDGVFGRLNLLKNPGFEEGLKHWTDGKVNGEVVIFPDAKIKYAGKLSLRAEVSNRVFGLGKPPWLPIVQDLDVTPGKRYLVRAYMRTETKEGEVIPALKVQWAEGDPWDRRGCEKKWEMCRVTFTAKEKRARIIVVTVHPTERYNATLWVDEFYLAELPGE